MQDLKRQQDNDDPNFSWKNQMKTSLINMNIRIKILEQTGNVECTIRTKRSRTKLEKKIKESFTNA